MYHLYIATTWFGYSKVHVIRLYTRIKRKLFYLLVDERASINSKQNMYISNNIHSVSHYVILAFCKLFKLVICMCVLTATECDVLYVF
jgi:hypothetical protein